MGRKKPEKQPTIKKSDPRYEAKLKEEVRAWNPEFIEWLESKNKRKKSE